MSENQKNTSSGRQTWHINDDYELRKCTAQTPDNCDFKDRPHGELGVMGRIAEKEAERSILAERRLAKQAQRVSGVKNHRRNLTDQNQATSNEEPESPDSLRIPNHHPNPSARRRAIREKAQETPQSEATPPKPRPIPKPSPRPAPTPPPVGATKTLPSVADVSATELLPGGYSSDWSSGADVHYSEAHESSAGVRGRLLD